MSIRIGDNIIDGPRTEFEINIESEIDAKISEFITKYNITPNLIFINIDTNQLLIDALNDVSPHKVKEIIKYDNYTIKVVGMDKRVRVVLE